MSEQDVYLNDKCTVFLAKLHKNRGVFKSNFTGTVKERGRWIPP